MTTAPENTPTCPIDHTTLEGDYARDYFTDPYFTDNPHPFYDHLRSRSPVHPITHGVLAVTGYDEALEVLRNTTVYSNITAPIGPFPPLPFTPDGDDINHQIDEHRHQFPLNEHLVTMDPPRHTKIRRLLGGLFTPRRMEESEDFLWRLADRQIDEFLTTGTVEVLHGFAQPFALLTIADLLGVPETDHDDFRRHLLAQQVGALSEGEALATNPLDYLDTKFTAYLTDRRTHPQDDVLGALAAATYPDGQLPEVVELVRLATFLFGAGQDTTARLITAGIRHLAETPDLQAALRADHTLIGDFVEELLRMDGPVKGDFRLTRKTTELAGRTVPAGTVVMVLPGAANRDPARFEDPHTFDLGRVNAREHVAFGRGVHTCPGGPLARIEGRIAIERFLDRTTTLTINADRHGPVGRRSYRYEPTYILRGLAELHVDFTPAD